MNISKYILLYYGTISVGSLILIISLISALQWPFIAEIALGTALFLHALILSRTAKDLFLGALNKGLIHELLYSVKAGIEIPKGNSEA